MAKNLSTEEIKKYESSLRNILKLSKEINQFNDFNDDIMEDQVDMSEKMNAQAQKMLKALKDKKKINVNDLQTMKTQSDELSNILSITEKQIKLKKMEQDALDEINDKFDSMKAKIQAAFIKTKSFFMSWKGFAVGVGLIAVALFKVYKDLVAIQTEFRQDMGMTGAFFEQARDAATDISLSWAKFGVGMRESYEIVKGILTEFGSGNYLTKEMANNIAGMTVALGMSADEAAKTVSGFMNITGGSEQAANEMIKMAAATAKANDVPMGRTIRDIAENAEAVAKYTQGTGQNIVDATVAANKLGFSISTVAGIADSLLNFESSIEDQMNAMVLTGRSMNLDRARALALEGDLLGLQREITNNIASESEWNQMNMIERSAMADALGIGVDEMGKMISRQGTLNKLTKGTLKPMEAMAKGVTLSEVLDVEGIIDPLTKLGNSLIRIMSIIVKVFNPMFDLVNSVLDLFVGGEFKLLDFAKSVGYTILAVLGLAAAFRILRAVMTPLGKGIGKLFGLGGGGAEAAGAAGKKGIFGRIFGGMSWSGIAKGLVIMAALAATLWLLGNALQQFSGVGWGDLAKAGVAIVGLTAAVAILGAVMSSGVGTVAILAGAAALAIIAGALWIFGKALQEISSGLTGFVDKIVVLGSIGTDLMTAATAIGMLAGSISFLGAALAGGSVLDFFGFGGSGIIDKLIELANNADKLNVVADAVRTLASGGVGAGIAPAAAAVTTAGTNITVAPVGENITLSNVVDKLDEFMSRFDNGVDLKLQGAKIGEFLAKTARR